MLNPEQWTGVFGKTWVDRQTEPIFTLGTKRWTRYQLVSRVGVGNYRAVTILMDALQRLHVNSVKDLWNLSPVALASIKGVGVTTLFVTMSLLDSEEFNVKEWYAHHQTFTTLKNQEKKKKADAKKEARRARSRRKHSPEIA